MISVPAVADCGLAPVIASCVPPTAGAVPSPQEVATTELLDTHEPGELVQRLVKPSNFRIGEIEMTSESKSGPFSLGILIPLGNEYQVFRNVFGEPTERIGKGDREYLVFPITLAVDAAKRYAA